MSNTAGTIARISLLLTMLLGGWFLAVTALYALTISMAGTSFEWDQLAVLSGTIVLMRMVYPRNVFRW